MKISLSNQEEGHTILCLARYVGGVGTKSKIFFVMQFYDEVFARTVLNLTLKRQFKVEEIRKFQENARNCILNKWNSMIFLFWKHEKYKKFKMVLIKLWNCEINFQNQFHIGLISKYLYENWNSKFREGHCNNLDYLPYRFDNQTSIELFQFSKRLIFPRKVCRGWNNCYFCILVIAGLNFQTFTVKALIVTTKPQMVNAITMRSQKYK